MINLHALGHEKKEIPPWMFAVSGVAAQRIFANDTTYYIDYPIGWTRGNTITVQNGGTYVITGTVTYNNTR